MTHKPYLIPVSVKGVVLDDGKIWLRKNERDEWELPGGKLDPGEQPAQTVVRELYEELGFEIEVVGIVQAQMYTIHTSLDEDRGVLVVSYACRLIAKTGEFEYLGEAGKAEFKAHSLPEIRSLNMPEFYKSAVEVAAGLLNQ